MPPPPRWRTLGRPARRTRRARRERPCVACTTVSRLGIAARRAAPAAPGLRGAGPLPREPVATRGPHPNADEPGSMLPPASPTGPALARAVRAPPSALPPRRADSAPPPPVRAQPSAFDDRDVLP